MKRLLKMAKSRDPKLRAIAAGHPKIPLHAFYPFCLDADVDVRRAAVKNPKHGSTMCFILENDDDPGIRAYARMVLDGERYSD